ncbi:MAG TPA: hypothetical protein VN282_04815 [Pyrinomonadaceae bacterium]|nr:hypothetical protein [Pyrinomonadaceae bacterium]HWS86258.1 hypothetical protein [Pyrinomonadaceae bacterium]
MDHNPQSKPETEPRPAARAAEGEARRPFVEPEITAPVDVLEATTFFNTSTSGAAN